MCLGISRLSRPREFGNRLRLLPQHFDLRAQPRDRSIHRLLLFTHCAKQLQRFLRLAREFAKLHPLKSQFLTHGGQPSLERFHIHQGLLNR